MKTTRHYRSSSNMLFGLFIVTALLQALYIYLVIKNSFVSTTTVFLLCLFYSITLLSGIFIYLRQKNALNNKNAKPDAGLGNDKISPITDNTDHEINREIIDRFAEAEELIFTEIFKKLDDCTSLEQYGNMLLSNMAREFDLVQGLIFWQKSNTDTFTYISKYAFYSENLPEEIHSGIGLSGQVAKDAKPLLIDELPEKYGKIVSGLGTSKANFMGIFPIIFDESVIGIVELASFSRWKEQQEKLIEKVLNRAAFEMNRFSN